MNKSLHASGIFIALFLSGFIVAALALVTPWQFKAVVRMRRQHLVRPYAGVVAGLVDLPEHICAPAVLAACDVGPDDGGR